MSVCCETSVTQDTWGRDKIIRGSGRGTRYDPVVWGGVCAITINRMWCPHTYHPRSPGSRHGLGAQNGIWSLGGARETQTGKKRRADPCKMAFSSQGVGCRVSARGRRPPPRGAGGARPRSAAPVSHASPAPPPRPAPAPPPFRASPVPYPYPKYGFTRHVRRRAPHGTVY